MNKHLLLLTLLAAAPLYSSDSWYATGKLIGKDALHSYIKGNFEASYHKEEHPEVDELFAYIFSEQDYETEEYKQKYEEFKELVRGIQRGLEKVETPEEMGDLEEATFETYKAVFILAAESFATFDNPRTAVYFLRQIARYIEVFKETIENTVPAYRKQKELLATTKELAQQAEQSLESVNASSKYYSGLLTGLFFSIAVYGISKLAPKLLK